MKKLLPVKYPVITGHPSTAGLFSILGNYGNTKEWIYSNYIQIAAGIRNGDIYGGGSVDTIILPGYHAEKTCPFIIHSVLTRKTVDILCEDILDFIIKMINTENYLYLVADQQYFIERIGKTFPHDMFIYGYDMNEELLYVADFTFIGKYTYETIKMNDFKKGYDVITDKDDFHYYERGGVGIFHFDVNASYGFDLEFINEQLREFKNSMDYSERFRSTDNPFYKRSYGLNAYDILIEFLAQEKNNYEGMRKCLSVLKDHKKLMTDRLNYMMKYKYIDKYSLIVDYEDMYKRMDNLVLLFLKYEYTKKDAYIGQIISGLQMIKEKESQCLEIFQDNIG